MTRSLHLRILRSTLALLAVLVGLHAPARAQGGCLTNAPGDCPVGSTGSTGPQGVQGVQGSSGSPAPEVDPSLATGGLALLGGMVLVLRARRR